VELHAAHGFLLDQFLWPGTNLRTDRYGGPAITDRAAFVAEAAEAVRAATGPDFVVSIRISQWKESDYDARIVEEPDQLGQLIPMLRSAGADIFHVSTRRFWTPEWDGSDLGLAGWVNRRAGHRRRQRGPRHRRDGHADRPGGRADGRPPHR
jgi:2,4-dienoyl-CoA reductase-like NADH-dependent reductase (Old Yellow Enzyme family)